MTQILNCWIILSLSLGSFAALADESSSRIEADAMKRYAQALKKMKNPTPEDLDKLRKDIVEPASAASQKSFDHEIRNEMNKTIREAEIANRLLEKKYQGMLPSGEKLKELQNSPQPVGYKADTPSDSDDSGPLLPQTPPHAHLGGHGLPAPAPLTVIDGSNVPKELEFGGAQPSSSPLPLNPR